MKKLLLVISLLAMNSIASAGVVKNTQIVMVQPNNDGSVIIFFDGGDASGLTEICSFPILNNPGFKLRVADKEEDNTPGKVKPNVSAMVSSAYTAMAAGYSVDIYGTSECDGGFETVKLMRVKRNADFDNFYQ